MPALSLEAKKAARKEYLRNAAHEWRIKNAEKFNSTITCECGAEYKYSNKSKHVGTQLHQTLLVYQTEIKSLKNEIEVLKAQIERK